MKLPGSRWFYKQMAVHTATQNVDVSLALKFQKQLSNTSHKHGILDHVKQTKNANKEKCWQTGTIMCNIINMLIIKM